jgi:PAS domain S-box-containing protein
MEQQAGGGRSPTADDYPAGMPDITCFHERLLEHSQDGIYRLRLHPEFEVAYTNAALERIFQYPLEQFRAADLDFIVNLFCEEERDDILEVVAGRRFYSAEVRHMRAADGRELWMEVRNYPVYDESGRLVLFEGVMRDVTERELAIRALYAIEEDQRRLIESLPDLVMRIDSSGVFYEHVPTASTQPAKFFLGQAIERAIGGDCAATARHALGQALAGDARSFRCRIEIWGEERLYDIRFFPLDSGEVLAFMRDVTGEVWASEEEGRRRSRDELEGHVERQFGIHNPYNFTFREFTVLHLVARGESDKEIANELGIALSTVNKHVSNVLGKMNAASRTEAGVRAVQEGLASG